MRPPNRKPPPPPFQNEKKESQPIENYHIKPSKPDKYYTQADCHP